MLEQLLPNVFIATNSLTDLLVVKVKFMVSKNDRDITNDIDPEKNNILIMMDDGWSSQYEIGFKEMLSRDMVGTIAVITSFVDQRRYIANAELFEIYTYGWDIVSHTVSHQNLNEISRKKQTKELLKAAKWLKSHNFTRGLDTVVYPYGEYNQETLEIMKENNIINGRTTRYELNDDSYINRLEVDCFVVLYDDTTFYIKGLIDEALLQDKTLILVFHKYGEDDEYSYDTNKFIEVLDYLNEIRDKINIITYSQWTEYLDNVVNQSSEAG